MQQRTPWRQVRFLVGETKRVINSYLFGATEQGKG